MGEETLQRCKGTNLYTRNHLNTALQYALAVVHHHMLAYLMLVLIM